MEVPFQKTSQDFNSTLKFQGLEDLKCVVYEVNENQSFGLPQNPIDKNSMVADTIYLLPKQITVRVLVKDEDVATFKSSINEVQFSQNLFTVVSTANEVFNNLKILNYAKDVNSSVIGKVFYNIDLEETILVQSLTEAYTPTGSGAYNGNVKTGSKDPQRKRKSALKGFYD